MERFVDLLAALQNKSLLMCARHSVIAMARFAHPWRRSRHCLVTIGGRHYMPRFQVHWPSLVKWLCDPSSVHACIRYSTLLGEAVV